MKCIDNVQVGMRLGQIQKKRDLNNLNFALELGLSQSRYSRLKNGIVTITVDELRKVCALYGLTAQQVLFGHSPRVTSPIFKRLHHLDEHGRRKCLKMLACSIDRDSVEEELRSHPMYKLFMGGLLEIIPVGTVDVLPYVLRYEKTINCLKRDQMLERLSLTRFKWDTVMRGVTAGEVSLLLRIEEEFGYDIQFLVNNQISGNDFFDKVLKKQAERRERILGLFDEIQRFGEQEFLVEMQSRERE